MPGPMEDVRVVEMGVWVAGPAAGGILADWGADVVKIEPPEIGDPARLFGQMLGGDLPFNPPFEMDNRIDDAEADVHVRSLMQFAWKVVADTGDAALLNSHYPILRLAPYGPDLA